MKVNRDVAMHMRINMHMKMHMNMHMKMHKNMNMNENSMFKHNWICFIFLPEFVCAGFNAFCAGFRIAEGAISALFLLNQSKCEHSNRKKKKKSKRGNGWSNSK
jgi:hypothetical protein